jgi:hypothetical protein
MARQHIFTRQYWRDFRIDFQRADKDPRARNRLWLRCVFLIYLMAVVTYYSIFFSSFHDLPTAVGVGVVTVVILGGMRAAAWSEDRAARRQNLADIAAVPVETTARVQRLAHGLAAITERALSEAWLRHNQVPEGHSPVMRRISLEALRKHGAWDDMPADARDWMIRPDGAWPSERNVAVLLRAETLNTLLWALALTDTLRPVEDFLKTLSLKELARAMQKPAPGIRPTWDMRLERDRAYAYFNRCYAEGVHRGVIAAQSEEQRLFVERWINEIAETPGGDYLAGAATIGELNNDKLQQVVMSAISRATTLRLLMSAVDGQDVWEELYGHVYGALLQPFAAETPDS